MRTIKTALRSGFVKTQATRVRSGFVRDIQDLGLEVGGDPCVLTEEEFRSYGFSERTIKNGPRYLLNNKASEKRGEFYAVARGVATGELAEELQVPENTPVIQIARVATKKEIGTHFLTE